MGEDHKGDVPFSWEQKPGVSKVTPQFPFHHHPKLPPPPPSRNFQAAAALRNPSQKGAMRKQDDPFLIAFRECTKSVRSSKGSRFAWFSRDDAAAARGGVKKAAATKKKNNGGGNLFFSCKNSCSVMEDKVVRVSQLPRSRSLGEEDVCIKWTP